MDNRNTPWQTFWKQTYPWNVVWEESMIIMMLIEKHTATIGAVALLGADIDVSALELVFIINKKASHSFKVSIPCDILWHTVILLLFYFKYQYRPTDLLTSVVQEHLRSDALPDTTVIRRESNTGPLVWETLPYPLHHSDSLVFNIKVHSEINCKILPFTRLQMITI